MKEIEELQAKAAQCRRLARDAMDVSVSVSLDALAVELMPRLKLHRQR